MTAVFLRKSPCSSRVAQALAVVGLCMTQAAVWANDSPAINLETLLVQAEKACEQGDAARLAALSQRIQALTQQPALQGQADFLSKLMALFRHGVCHPGEPQGVGSRTVLPGKVAKTAPVHSRSVQVTAGYLDNVNQGSRHERIMFNSPFSGLPVEGTLDERNRPLSSAFVSAQGLYRLEKDGGRKVIQAGVAHQAYTDEPNFSTISFFVGRQQALDDGREASAYLNLVRDETGNGEGRLGGVYYQPWLANAQSKTGVLTSLEYVAYPKQRAYESAVANVALEHRKVLVDGDEVGFRGRLEYDRALDNRPGGDRRELELSGEWKGKPFTGGWQPTAGLKLAHKLDEKPFDLKLYGGSKRDQTRAQLDVGLNKPFNSKQKLYINYQYGRTRDGGVPLFDQPAGSVLGVTLETRF